MHIVLFILIDKAKKWMLTLLWAYFHLISHRRFYLASISSANTLNLHIKKTSISTQRITLVLKYPFPFIYNISFTLLLLLITGVTLPSAAFPSSSEHPERLMWNIVFKLSWPFSDKYAVTVSVLFFYWKLTILTHLPATKHLLCCFACIQLQIQGKCERSFDYTIRSKSAFGSVTVGRMAALSAFVVWHSINFFAYKKFQT